MRRGGLAGLGRRLYENFFEHAVTSNAATLSFYFIFSLFPFLMVLVMITKHLPLLSPSMQRILAAGRDVLPPEAMSIIESHIEGGHPPPKFLTLGLLVTLYSASRGVDAVRGSLNLSYGVKESRSWWRTQGLAIGAVVGGALLALISVTVAVIGGDVGYWLSRHLGIAGLYVDAWRWARWPVTALLTMLMAALGYYALPNVKQEFKLITPGSVLCTVAALVATSGFSEYAAHFGRYDVAYGSLGGAVILMTWFYILGILYLVGGELDATLEHESPERKQQAAQARRPQPPTVAPLRPSRTPST